MYDPGHPAPELLDDDDLEFDRGMFGILVFLDVFWMGVQATTLNERLRLKDFGGRHVDAL